MGEPGVTSFRLPDYTLVKLLASYAFTEQFTISGEVSNLFDKHYYPSSYSRLWVTPGMPGCVAAASQRGNWRLFDEDNPRNAVTVFAALEWE